MVNVFLNVRVESIVDVAEGTFRLLHWRKDFEVGGLCAADARVVRKLRPAL